MTAVNKLLHQPGVPRRNIMGAMVYRTSSPAVIVQDQGGDGLATKSVAQALAQNAKEVSEDEEERKARELSKSKANLLFGIGKSSSKSLLPASP